MSTEDQGFVIVSDTTPGEDVLSKIRQFLKKVPTVEANRGVVLPVYYDRKSRAHYLICHILGEAVKSKTDINAVLDPTETEEYKLNRDIYTDTYAYQIMQVDALLERSFEDIVSEYVTSYRPSRPLKIFGGQHRVMAINEAFEKGVNSPHGVRVYFDLSTDQRLEIATVNNTSIAVSNDLLDRMQEEWLGQELRTWCQEVGFLRGDQNFADKRNSSGIPTVRVARTLVVNYFKGKHGEVGSVHDPKVCQSGAGIDQDYESVRSELDWDDEALTVMGTEFSRLHRLQRERVTGRDTDTHQEFANKVIHPFVVAAWGYAAGLLESDSKSLKAHYGLADSVSRSGKSDPMNAKALSTARLKGVDPDTYRGLGARINKIELGRMLELFILQATKASRRGITTKLANAAIQSFEAKKAQQLAAKAIRNI